MNKIKQALALHRVLEIRKAELERIERELRAKK